MTAVIPLPEFTKNGCVCEKDSEEVVAPIVDEEDAHIIVPEWRLQKVQSPIKLTHDESNEYDHFEPLEFHGHWDKGGKATFKNNGYTATLRFQERELPLLFGGPLHHDQYVFEQLHFHWSDDDHSGCEHIFEGKAYSMEAHVVHYNKKYGSFKEALDKDDGVQKIQKINSSTEVASDCLTWMTEAAKCKGYYTYQGSLTTEPYTESVTWILYPTPIHVSREQVAHFREMKSSPCETFNIVNNVRPLQTPPPHKKLDVIYARSHKNSG
ncbi:hypothetical protein WA026_019690 [Henosepilachna vigintioctopunctata]|uniref:Alpha-carbonic anhydrase domain-containing protein n=1 Tax=Henosepilachna vigintioctopunctata TaxID=420089 RepID=A0AAW1UES1_9CUCU